VASIRSSSDGSQAITDLLVKPTRGAARPVH
jgi:hypothetical protein